MPATEAAAVHSQGRWFPGLLGEGAGTPQGVVDEYLAVVSPWGSPPRT